jgi:hypothetical protein
VRALVAYTWSNVARSQRWVPPLVLFGAVLAIFSASTGSVLPSYSGVAASLLFIATWVSLIFANTEDAIQVAVTQTAAGSRAKVRLAKLLAAYLFAVVLGLLGLVGPAVASPSGVTLSAVLIGASEMAITALAGVAIGALCSRPIIKRTAWAFFSAIIGCLVIVLVPHCPPTDQLILLFDHTRPQHVPLAMIAIAGETVALAFVMISASLRVAKARS